MLVSVYAGGGRRFDRQHSRRQCLKESRPNRAAIRLFVSGAHLHQSPIMNRYGSDLDVKGSAYRER